MTTNHKRKQKSRIRNGITRDAKELGVTRQHLWAVVTHRRESKPLLGRYRALKRSQRQAS